MEKDNNKQFILENIHKMLQPWIMRGEEDNYFRVKIMISGNEEGRKHGMGLIMSGSPKDAKDRIVFESSWLHEATQSMYKTINGKPLQDLNITDLETLQTAVEEYVKKGKVYPAILRDYYSDEISSENDWFTSVDFKRPVDAEMYSINDYILDRDKNDAILPDFDQAIYYAEQVSTALERRGQVWDEMIGNDRVFHSTFESDDSRILEAVKFYNGTAVVSHDEGVTLTMATFPIGRDARRFSEDVNRELNTDYFKTSAAAKVGEILSNKLTNGKIELNTPITLFYRASRYKDGDIRNIKTISWDSKENTFVASNSSRHVRVDELTPTGSRALLRALNEVIENRHLGEESEITIESLAKNIVDDFKERVINPGSRSFSEKTRRDITNLTELINSRGFDDFTKNNILHNIKREVFADPEVKRQPAEWFTAASEEFDDIVNGNVRENSRCLKI